MSSSTNAIGSSSVAVTYTFTSYDPWDTQLIPDTSLDEFPAYTVNSVQKRQKLFGRFKTDGDSYNTVTTITDDEDVLIASLVWNENLPDTVIYGGQPTSINNWMHRPLLDASKRTFQDEKGRKYEWRNIRKYRRMELYAEDKPEESIIRFLPANKDFKTGEITTSKLILTERAAEIYELVIVSFLFLEKTRRRKEKEAERLASVAFNRSQRAW
ncbi:hypothetical protein M422DRAFT_269733 [Sphaerobolus stellatus SS14]|uniref:DUF6593 domain-containing protein n=1 Tax=Sphaerobolus stellatus (strain SS14) TaxID=990650 RepID=A0A0C9THJ7_SPHS4|nr:hypothetical protein M422DRAFT_269733 [Sphaerobolus stellatus SS14]